MAKRYGVQEASVRAGLRSLIIFICADLLAARAGAKHAACKRNDSALTRVSMKD